MRLGPENFPKIHTSCKCSSCHREQKRRSTLIYYLIQEIAILTMMMRTTKTIFKAVAAAVAGACVFMRYHRTKYKNIYGRLFSIDENLNLWHSHLLMRQLHIDVCIKAFSNDLCATINGECRFEDA